MSKNWRPRDVGAFRRVSLSGVSLFWIILVTVSIKVSSAMKMMINLTSCLPTAWEVHQLFIGGRCEKQWDEY